MAVSFLNKYVKDFVSDSEVAAFQDRISAAHRALHEKTGAGSDYTGWVDLPVDYDKDEFARIKAAAKKIQKTSDVLIVIGIGGSYLGARAVIECLKSQNYNVLRDGTPAIYFSGNSLSATALNELLAIVKDKDFSVNVISKSGTTTEPAIAFRVFRALLLERYGKEGAKDRIFVTTDKAKGTLKSLADSEGYETFVVPDDVGGRYSVLTAVGLLPIAAAGIDIDLLMGGAAKARLALQSDDLNKNDCYRYVAVRNALYEKGKAAEMFVSYEPNFLMMNEWIKQLFGESEGKILFETVIDFKKGQADYEIGEDPQNIDGLNFLAGKPMSFVSRKAFEGTLLAHNDGAVPNVVLEADAMDEDTLGYLLYYLEKACAVSGYVLGVNPFDQPGVESYKRNMFALLGKPGYEKEKEALERRLGL